MFHSYLGTLLYYSFFFFFLSIIIRSSLFPRCSIFPCTRVLSCPRVSSYLSIASIPPFFPFVLPPLSSVFNGLRVFYIPLPPLPIFRYSSHRSNHLCASRFCTAYLVILAPTFFLSQNLSFSLCVHVYIPHSSSVLHPILVIFISHKFNPTSLRLAPYTFHCSIKRPTRICTRVYTMNSVVVQKANRIRVGHDTS